jgi:hypothetical protein
MELNTILMIIGGFLLSILVTYFVTNWIADKRITEYKSITKAIDESISTLVDTEHSVLEAKQLYEELNEETADLQQLRLNAKTIASDMESNKLILSDINKQLEELKSTTKLKADELQTIMLKVDVYSRIEQLVDHGHYEMPEYLYETSARFAEEIKRLRESQKEMIKNKLAITYPEDTLISDNKSLNTKILNGQVKLMLTAFNIECDELIGKVKPSSFPRTLERIEKLANTLEKSASSLHCGFEIQYVELKYEECRLQYQFMLKKQQEQEEQKLIRDQMREEQKAIKEYEKAVAEAEKEERMYRDMLGKARAELRKVSEEDRVITEQKIADLEAKLAEAEAKEQRAKSMAEQTRKGHVYVISNVGSFGHDIYKIGLTRRLEPMDRVKELGDASVPFTFDVHAMIYVDDAPSLERALHKEFSQSRVNAVNHRKEFFRTDLDSIKDTVERVAGIDVDFKMTIAAEEYYESRRINGMVAEKEL